MELVSGRIVNLEVRTYTGVIPSTSGIQIVGCERYYWQISYGSLKIMNWKTTCDGDIGIGYLIPSTYQSLVIQAPGNNPLFGYQHIIVDGGVHYHGMGYEGAEGNPAIPSLKMSVGGRYRFRWKVNAGIRTIRVNVKQATNQNPRPMLTVFANKDIGVMEDFSLFAPEGADWVIIGPLGVSPTSNGVLWVELRADYRGDLFGAPCYWDHLVTT